MDCVIRRTLRFMFLTALVAATALALPGLSGTVREESLGPIDGATVTVMDASTGKGIQTSSTTGTFSISGLRVADYLIRGENAGCLPVLGLVHLSGDEMHSISVVMLKAVPSDACSSGAASPLRSQVRPERSSPKPPKVRPAEVRQKVLPVYPEADRRAGIEGTVRLSMILLPAERRGSGCTFRTGRRHGRSRVAGSGRWRYSPTYPDDQPVEASHTVDVTFQKH
jgi:hypothetical protein